MDHILTFIFSYLICLTIAPAFFTAGIYLCLGRIVAVYGTECSRVKPKTYTYVFVTCDLISLILQAAGGAITSVADDDSTRDKGVNIMIAGLAFQVASIAVFMALASEYGFRVWQGKYKKYNAMDTIGKQAISWQHKAFLIGMIFYPFCYCFGKTNRIPSQVLPLQPSLFSSGRSSELRSSRVAFTASWLMTKSR